ncbi:hypothetical protein ACQP3L_34775, partial [Escherichia coli]
THSQFLLTKEGLCKLLKVKCVLSAAWRSTETILVMRFHLQPQSHHPELVGWGLDRGKTTPSLVSGKRWKLRGDKIGTFLHHC